MSNLKPKHTPGPWIEDGECDEHVFYTGKGKLRTIAHVQADNFSDVLLMAAAPDMLEAIETVVNKETGLSFDALCILKDAIRKAKGESK
jgi:hypothetical protein